jgi:hypothetical protein
MEREVSAHLARTELPSMRRTEPGAFLALSDPSSDDAAMIERLAENPEGKSVEAWLREVAKDTVLHLSGAHNG